jgi:Kef-type K+ transport system membrane component KefB
LIPLVFVTLFIVYLARQSLLDNLEQEVSLVLTVLMGWIGGQISTGLGQDAMLGMLLTGILLRNLFPSIIVPIPHSWTAILWTTALASVISRAGLSLQKHKILPNIVESIFLGIIPVVTEGVVTAFVAKLFFGIPPAWAFTLAFGVASISPGVVVPLILKLIDSGWQQSRLPPLLLTALGIDVLVGTSGFGIALAACFGHKHEQNNQNHQSWVGRGLEEIGMGIVLGFTLGTIGYMYSKCKLPEIVASTLVFVGSSCTMIWCKTHGYAGAASCSTFITWGFIANSWTKLDIEKVDTK